MSRDEHALSAGDVVDARFRVEARIGAGGMGEVYLARQLNVDRPVALKLMRQERSRDQRAVAQFLSEATAISRLTSPHTVTFFDVGKLSDGSPFISMELLEGHTLRARMRDGRLSQREALRIIDGVALSLAEAHARGIVHRDIKPSNVMLTHTPGHRAHVKVLDFGLARLAEAKTERLRVAGTLLYMAPEALREGQITPRTDVYALAMLAYELFAGTHPFAELQRDALVEAISTEVPPALDSTELPAKLVHLLARSLAKTPRLRPENASAFRSQLLDAFGEGDTTDDDGAFASTGVTEEKLTTVGPTVAPLDVAPMAATPTSGGSRRWVLGGGLAAIAVALVTMGLWQRAGGEDGPRAALAPTLASPSMDRSVATTARGGPEPTPVPPAAAPELGPPSARLSIPSAQPPSARASSSARAPAQVARPPGSAAPEQVAPPPEPAVSSDPCPNTLSCSSSGRCTLRAGKCSLGSSADCARTDDCKALGHCTFASGRCLAGSDAECRASESCKNSGMCDASNGKCVVTPAGCAASYKCSFHAQCGFAEGQCKVVSDAACATSGGCKKRGWCTLVGKSCAVASDADCQRSELCTRDGFCRRHTNICIR